MLPLLLLACAPHPVAVQVASAPPVLHAMTPTPLPAATLLDRNGVAMSGDVKWSTADPTIARIDGATLVPLKNGTTTLVARSGAAVGEWAVKVAVPTRITVTSPDLELVPTQRVALIAAPYADDEPLGSGAVLWSSSDETVLRVAKFGQADALKGGDVEVKATLGDAVGVLAIHILPDPPPTVAGIGTLEGRGTGIEDLVSRMDNQAGFTGTVVPPRSAGTLAVGALHVGSGLTTTQVESSLKRTMNQLRYCYQRVLTRNATLAGRVDLVFDIQADGTTSAVGLTSSTIGEAEVSDCILGRIGRVQFPAPTTPPTHVSLGLVMAPGL